MENRDTHSRDRPLASELGVPARNLVGGFPLTERLKLIPPRASTDPALAIGSLMQLMNGD